MKHRGTRPPGQPRTVRTQAEDIGTSAQGFEPDLPYDTSGGRPMAHPGSAGTYYDMADQARPPAGEGKRQRTSADPKPY